MGPMTRGARADELAVRPVRAGDATALVRCVERCYGASYPNPAFYDAAALRSMIESGDHGGAVALDGGVLIGHIAMRPAARGSSVVEAGTTIVDPAHRGRGVMGLLAAEIVRQCREHGIDGFVHFPTTAHTVMQRVSIAEGGRETGVLIGYIPAQTADLAIERAAAGRLAVTVVYQPISAAPAQTLFVPGRYERLLLTMAAELGLERPWVRPGRPAAGPTEIKQSTDGARSLERAAVDQIGADIAVIAGTLVALERDLVHVDLPDRKSTRLNSSHIQKSRMPSSA